MAWRGDNCRQLGDRPAAVQSLKPISSPQFPQFYQDFFASPTLITLYSVFAGVSRRCFAGLLSVEWSIPAIREE